jgi:hypothetical protein
MLPKPLIPHLLVHFLMNLVILERKRFLNYRIEKRREIKRTKKKKMEERARRRQKKKTALHPCGQ